MGNFFLILPILKSYEIQYACIMFVKGISCDNFFLWVHLICFKSIVQAALNEIKVLSMLQHPNVIEYFENFLQVQWIIPKNQVSIYSNRGIAPV